MTAPNSVAPSSVNRRLPDVGEIVQVRTRQYLVEGLSESRNPKTTVVRLACIDDDAQGDILEVIWGAELDAKILDAVNWNSLSERGFDSPRVFSAYYHTLRWNCVTATNPRLFQAPFRAGIKIDHYQIEPLRKALLLPRVNLFIADDVGLGKTIEAGLIARELLLRKKVRDIVVACPPSVLPQWKTELEQRFGLGFEVIDREYFTRVRQERGFSTNPWTTHSRFLISHRLLIDENYVGPLRDWLGAFRQGSLFILDEAHHAAPATSSKYAIDSKITRAVRDIAPKFEHRLFLSATPHNGHSNSFSALLEILDPQRFCRGIPIKGKKLLDDVMVRRLKEDIRSIQGGFPKRLVQQIDIDGLPKDAPELRLAELLGEYRELREKELESKSKREQAAATILIIGLQQRLLSSIEAFVRTLKVHRKTLEKQKAKAKPVVNEGLFETLTEGIDADSDLAGLEVETLENLESEQIQAATEAGFSDGGDSRIVAVLDQMEAIASDARAKPDARVTKFLEWVKERMCEGVRIVGEKPAANKSWTETRVILFTEYEATLTYLQTQLEEALSSTDQFEDRVLVYRGSTSSDERERIKRAFNGDPKKYPVRILLCTDAAREGINLQTHCADLFHFDVPWNPSRMEQRNGRIDRKLQPRDEVRCHYFVYKQRPEDRILQALVRKTETIKKELGSLSQVVEGKLGKTLQKSGILRAQAKYLEEEIESANLDDETRQTIEEELEESRERQEKLTEQFEQLRGYLNTSREWVGLESDDFRATLSSALEIVGASPLQPLGATEGAYRFPEVDRVERADSSWADTLDTLRSPREKDQKFWEWRRESKLRPVVFEDPGTMTDDVVHLHLEHPVVRRLLGRFTSQGFLHDDISRACLIQTKDSFRRVVLLGRLCLYGAGAARLHEEIITVAARWTERKQGEKGLTPYASDAENKTLDLLDESLLKPHVVVNQVVLDNLQKSGSRDVVELLAPLQKRGEELAAEAKKKLATRGEDEAKKMREILIAQKERIEKTNQKTATVTASLFNQEEMKQLEADRTHWGKRLAEIDKELEEEPKRIREQYEVKAQRVEPVGLVYLWPETG